MKHLLSLVIGLIIGGLVVYLINRNDQPDSYFLENQSIYGFEETVAQFEAGIAEYEGWKILKTYDLQESMAKSGFNVQAVKVFSLCNPAYSSKILFSNQERVVSSMMPCRVAIYVRTNGKTYISRMNSAEMAAKMGGIVEDVMTAADHDVADMIKDLVIE